MESGTIVRWLKSEGEDVSELLAAAAQSGNGGTPAPAPPEAGGEAPSGSEPQGAPAPAPAEERAPEGAAPRAGREPGERVKASPLARRIARERGIELAALTGTGPDGRIIAEDVEKAQAAPAAALARAAAAAPAGEAEVVELTSVRKTIARRLTQAWEAPVFQLTASADASA